MNEVPRDANGWPTVYHKSFTLEQLINEAHKWCSSSINGE